MRLAAVALFLVAAPLLAQQFPLPVPQECVLLAKREHVPIVIKNGSSGNRVDESNGKCGLKPHGYWVAGVS